ncbi:MAG: MFS transporter [Candidatus Marinimicrobia bacterium]|nr:MFS transporter [Candidatus Neomarinimicrobiota bacterium]
MTKLTDRKSIFAWTMYDFANSAFTTLVVTFIYGTYFVKAIAADEISGTVLWSRAVTVTALTVALLSPYLGALADRGGYRKQLLFMFTAICVVGTACLYDILPGQVLKALMVFVVANIAFEMCGVFYNAFLVDIAPSDRIGRISGYGWSLGYVGGLVAMALAMIGFVSPETPWFGLTSEAGQNIRATNLLVAVWFGVFSIPMFLWVREKPKAKPPGLRRVFSEAGQQLVATIGHIRQFREVAKFLLARMIYNDALVTIFAFGGIYAAGTFGFTFQEIMIFGIVLNVAAGAGAYVMGFIDDRLGGKTTIQISNAGLLLVTILAAVATSKAMFWVAGVFVGLLVGPNQSASRSLMGRFSPEAKKSQFFGFYAFSGKATAFVGPLLLGILTQVFESQRAGIWVVAIMFAIGGLLLRRVNENVGIQAAASD